METITATERIAAMLATVASGEMSATISTGARRRKCATVAPLSMDPRMSMRTRRSSLIKLATQPRGHRSAFRAMSANRTTTAMLAREVQLSIIAVIAIAAIVSNKAMRNSAVSVASKAIAASVDTFAFVDGVAMAAFTASIATKAELETLDTLCTLAHLANRASVARRVELAQ